MPGPVVENCPNCPLITDPVAGIESYPLIANELDVGVNTKVFALDKSGIVEANKANKILFIVIPLVNEICTINLPTGKIRFNGSKLIVL